MKKKFIVMCAAFLPLASCGLLDDDKEITSSGDDNYVSVSVSDVKDGYFKLDFECGEGTQTIEYAVCRAVNMKTDSVAFKAGELDGVQRIELSDSVTVATVEYDCSEPLDFGPYTVYARAVSSTGEVSAPVKAQVCALTTGVTPIMEMDLLSICTEVLKRLFMRGWETLSKQVWTDSLIICCQRQKSRHGLTYPRLFLLTDKN